jgi:mannitol/fructose-specific phosphotransferase system IIA component (Ntr-type)
MNAPGSPAVILHQLLTAHTVKLMLTSGTRDEVLLELIAQIPQLTGQPESRQRLFRALQDREQLHSTGIGDGIALPHARNALAGVVEQPVIVFGRHAQGIAYGAVDGKPARLFFLLVTPSVTQHLAILARISRLLRSAELRQGLLAADTPDRVIALLRDAELKLQSVP